MGVAGLLLLRTRSSNDDDDGGGEESLYFSSLEIRTRGSALNESAAATAAAAIILSALIGRKTRGLAARRKPTMMMAMKNLFNRNALLNLVFSCGGGQISPHFFLILHNTPMIRYFFPSHACQIYFFTLHFFLGEL